MFGRSKKLLVSEFVYYCKHLVLRDDPASAIQLTPLLLPQNNQFLLKSLNYVLLKVEGAFECW